MVNAARGSLKGRYVQFLVRDIHLPEPTTVLHELHGEDVLSGTVVDLSDSTHADGAAFAIVRVARLRQPCIVPVDRLLRGK